MFITTGEIVRSDGSAYIEWKIHNYLDIIDNITDLYETKSPSFQYNNKSLQICLNHNVLEEENYQVGVGLRLLMTSNEENVTCFLICAGVKIDNVYYKHCAEIPQPYNGLYIGCLEKFRSNINKSEENNEITLFVQFRLHHARMHSMHSAIFSRLRSRNAAETSSPTSSKDIADNHGFKVLSENLTDSYLQGEHCDITIHVGERQFQAHKFILAARSSVFAAMVKHDMIEKNSNSITVNDCEADIFEEFLYYLYSATVKKLSNENVLELYTVADMYNVDFLKAECVKYMNSNLSVDMFCDVVKLATKYNELELLKLSKEYFTKNVKKILLSTNWQAFLKENPVLGNELFLLIVPDTSP